jgi:hypothetical protein
MEIAIAKIRKGATDIDFSSFSVLSRDKRNRSILHIAVELGRLDLVKKLVKVSSKDTILHLLIKCKGGRTIVQNPIQLAARVGNIKMLQYLVNLDLCVSWSHFGSFCEKIYALPLRDEIREILVHAARRSGLSNSFNSIIDANDLSVLKKIMTGFFWWENRFKVSWSYLEQYYLMRILCNIACNAKYDCFEFLFESTKIRLQEDLYEARNEKLSVPDYVVIQHNMSYYGHKFPIADERFQVLNSSKDSEMAEEFHEYLSAYSSFCKQWSGKPESLIEESKSSEIKKWKSYSDNLYKIILESSDAPGRVAALEYMANIYLKNTGKILQISNYYPRLDLIVLYWQIGIFKWLISSKFINLLEATLFLDDDKKELKYPDESDELESVHEECPICYNAKKHAQTFGCRHSFCIRCSMRMFIAKGKFQEIKCPLCRIRLNKPSISFSLVTRLLYQTQKSAPWMKNYFSCNELFPLAKYLLALSAGSDSMLIFYEILKIAEFDLLEIKFKDESNIMHVVCENGSMFVFKWLVQNGFSSLIHQKRKDGVFPWQLSISCLLPGSFDIFSYAVGNLDLPDTWLELAKSSENSKVLQIAHQKEYDIILEKIQILENCRKAKFEKFVFLFNHSNFIQTVLCSSDNAVKYFLETVIPSERLDIFSLFIDSVEKDTKGKELEILNALFEAIPHDCIHKQVYISKLYLSLTNHKYLSKLSEIFGKFCEIFEEKRPFEEIDTLLQEQSSLIFLIDPKYLDESKLASLSEKNLLDAFDQNKSDLVSKLLKRNEYKNDFEFISKTLLGEVDLGQFDAAKVLFSHLRKYGALEFKHIKHIITI